MAHACPLVPGPQLHAREERDVHVILTSNENDNDPNREYTLKLEIILEIVKVQILSFLLLSLKCR